MSAATAAPSATPSAALRDERIIYGAVHLDVVDLERSLDFWQGLIGLRPAAAAGEGVALGAGGEPLVVLHPGATRPVGRGHAGLYHLALHVPDQVEFARVIVRLARAGVPQSPTDHVFSRATYLRDPDGIMLEVTLETPELYGSVEIGPAGVVFRDSAGRPRGGTEPLDVAAAIAPLDGGDPIRPLAAGSYVGHVHLHVPDLRAAHDFYRDVVGFSEHSYMTEIGMADLGAGGPFPHRIALNDWHGPQARRPASGTAGMRRFELQVRSGPDLARLAARAGADPDRDGSAGLTLLDPAGNEVLVRAGGR